MIRGNRICVSILLFIIITLSSHDNFAQINDSLKTDSLNINQKIFPLGDIKETSAPLTGDDLVQSDFLGSWPMFGKEYRIKIGGYVKADALYDIDGTTDNTQFLMSTIPVKGQPEYQNHGYFNLFAKETRFNIDVRRIGEGKIPLKLFIEGDFWSVGKNFRLRHAYITIGNFIVGQTWTTLSILESLPFTIDFAAGDALFGGRTTQIRYQKNLSDQLKIAIGLENLDFFGIENTSNLPGYPSTQLPVAALRFDYSWSNGVLVVGSSVGQLRWDGGADGTSETIQYDVVIAGRQYIGKDNFVTWNFSVGKGAGENIMAFAGSDANAVLTPEGVLETMPALAILFGFMHRWSENFSSNFTYAYGWLDTPPTRDPYALMRGGVGHLNLIYRPINYLSTGIEYIWGAQRTSNEAFGSASRVQTMVKFEF